MGKTFSTGLLTNGLWQDSSNNIGIGAAPSGTYKLEVTGTAKVSSTLLVSGASTLTGAVGVGITAPSSGLEVYNSGGGPTIRVTNSGTGTGSGNGFHIGTDGSSPFDVAFVQNENASQVFYTNDGTSTAERLRIRSGGKVTIPSGAYGTSYYTMNYTSANAGSREWAIGSDTAGWGSFSIGQATTQGGSTFSDKIIISSAGNVGIGINSTSAKLYVLGSNEVFNVAGTNAVSTYTGYYYNTSTLVGYIGNGSSILSGAASDSFIFRSEGALVYAIGNSEKMRISSSGKLQAISTIAGDVIMDFRNDSATGYGGAIKGGSGSLYAFKVEDYVSNIRFRVDGNGGIYAPNIGAATGTAMILDSAGYLRTSTSSIRYKKDIKPIDIGLDFILSLNPVSYNLKNGDTPQVGFIAEDFPDDRLVALSLIDNSDESKGYQRESVNYAQIVAPLVKAIQELNERLNKAGL